MLEQVWGVSNAGRSWDLLPFCFPISDNPKPATPGFTRFGKYVRVLNMLDIFAESTVSDDIVRHAAAIAAEMLDNDDDGNVDNPDLATAQS
mgnify:CR=1 FL=1